MKIAASDKRVLTSSIVSWPTYSIFGASSIKRKILCWYLAPPGLPAMMKRALVLLNRFARSTKISGCFHDLIFATQATIGGVLFVNKWSGTGWALGITILSRPKLDFNSPACEAVCEISKSACLKPYLPRCSVMKLAIKCTPNGTGFFLQA